MPEEVLFTFEQTMSRDEIADYLRTVADRIAGGEISLESGDQQLTLTPPQRSTFEVKAERETPTGGGSGELSIEFELEWDEDATEGGDSLTIG